MSPLSPEHNFILAIAAKAAVLNAPLPDSDLFAWWQPLGMIWLNTLCDRIKINGDRLPDTPSIDDARGLASSLPDAVHSDVASTLLSSTLLLPVNPTQNPAAPSSTPKILTTPHTSSSKSSSSEDLVYAASTRAFIFRTLDLLNVSRRHLLSSEVVLSKDLYHKLKESELKERGEELRKEKEQGWGGSWGRWAATGAGVTVGAVVLGLTGGLAAPALLPLIPFLSAGAAPVVLGSVFGLAGGGLTGYRVRRRWGGVEKFEFVEISGPGEGEGDPGLKQSEKSKAPSLTAVMMIPGLQLDSETETLETSKACRDLFAPYDQDLYFVSHSPDVMLATGKALHGWVMSQLYSKAGKEILKRTAFNAVLAAVAMPVSIYKTTGMVIDNQWIQGTDKARKAGVLLADVIKEKVHGNRPLVLIGSSLGALALFEALLTLAEASPLAAELGAQEGHKTSSNAISGPLIDSAIFISLPTAPSAAQWASIRRVVSRRIVNAYCPSDFVLAGVGRLHEVLGGANIGGMAGVEAVREEVMKKAGVENVDVGDVMGGHFELREKLPAILEKVGIDD